MNPSISEPYRKTRSCWHHVDFSNNKSQSEVEVVKIGTSYIKSIIVDSPKYLQNNYYNSAGLGSKEL